MGENSRKMNALPSLGEAECKRVMSCSTCLKKGSVLYKGEKMGKTSGKEEREGHVRELKGRTGWEL